MFYRSLNRLTPKDPNSKIDIFGHFYLFTDTPIKLREVNSKDFAHKSKKNEENNFVIFYFFQFCSNVDDYNMKKPLF